MAEGGPPDTDEERASESEFAAHWREEPRIDPPRGLGRGSDGLPERLLQQLRGRPFPERFEAFGDLLRWERRWERLFDDSNAPFYRWFVGGRLNASVNCVDRHAESDPGRLAFTFVPEDEGRPPEPIRYADLFERVNATAAVLRDRVGLEAGDRATLYLPMTPELPITMLACARLGVVHSVVFAGFSGEACGHRLADSGSRVLVTADRYARAGRWHDHKRAADRAIEVARSEGSEVESLLVWEREPGRYGSASKLVKGRDELMRPLLEEVEGVRVAPVPMPSEAPLFLMYTSGTTGRPKGVQHGTGGYLAYAAATARLFLDLRPSDTYWCLADIGWITGHSYLVYGPLALGVSSILYEGHPAFPDAERPWRVAREQRVSVLYTSPTLIRQLRRQSPGGPGDDRPPFRLLGTVGEPIEPETWRWYFESVGGGRAAVVDTYWQTETGGILAATLPPSDPMKPGSAGPFLPGIDALVLDDAGAAVPPASGRAGSLCVTTPWPGLMQTIWGDPERYVSTYFARFRDPTKPGGMGWPYVTGDAATRAADGYFRILGRLDDVINVAGHRLGTKEIESACLGVPEVAEAAVVPLVDPLRGHLPEVFVTLRPGVAASPELAERVAEAIVRSIGAVARPRAVRIVPDLPKTRSGKIMRRVLSAIANGRETGDVTTLADPEIVEAIRRASTSTELNEP